MGPQEIRHRIMHTANGNMPSPAEVKDWAREDGVEFPARSQIRPWVREELLNRWRNFGLNYTHESAGQATNYDSMKQSVALHAMDGSDPKALAHWDKNIYKGPKTSWARFTSSAVVVDPNDETNVMKGFILMGNGNFHDTYGFDKGDGYNGGGGDAKTLLGYDTSSPTPKRHEIDEPDYKHRPSPGVVSVDSEDIEPGKNFRRTTVNFTVWSQAQLDYMDAYFFQPGMSAIVEWGWNTYPREALLPLNEEGYEKLIPQIWNNGKTEKTKNYLEPPLPPSSKHLRLGQGNYGFAMGLIHSFTYSIRADGGYDCTCQVSCMSEIGNMVMTETGRKQKRDGTRTHDVRSFVKSALRRLLIGNDSDDFANQNQGKKMTADEMVKVYKAQQQQAANEGEFHKRDENRIQASHIEAIRVSRGRYFSFDPYTSTKPYYAGKNCQEGTYITVGYLLDIFNIFFARTSAGNQTKIWEVSCWGSRCVAHPNIKSVNGNILLIPNSLAPRWNNKTYHGSSIAVNPNSGQSSSASYNVLQKGEDETSTGNYKQTTQAFLDMVASMSGRKASGLTLEEAMKESPRDDLHRILAWNSLPGYNWQHPAIAGKLHKGIRSKVLAGEQVDNLSVAWEEVGDVVRPFPDLASPDITGPTLGYSGRIQDLFVNLNTIDECMEKNDVAERMILDIMTEVSTAAGSLWDFQLIGADTNTSSNVTLQLIDANFSGTQDVKTQKETALVFPTHRGDSIVREMSLDVDPKSELSSQIIFGNVDKDGGFYSKQDEDLILKHAVNPVQGTEEIENAEGTKPEMADNLKCIVAMSTKGLGPGKLGKFASYETDPDLGPYDVSYIPKGKTNSPENRETIETNTPEMMEEALATARKKGDESSIKTKAPKQIARDFGTSPSGSLGNDAKHRRWQIYVNAKFFNKVARTQQEKNAMLDGKREVFGDSKTRYNVPEKENSAYPTKIQRFLVGKTFILDGPKTHHTYGWHGEEVVCKYPEQGGRFGLPTEEPGKSSGSGKTFKIVGGSMIPESAMKNQEISQFAGSKNQYHFYRLLIQEVNPSGLSDSDMERAQNALASTHTEYKKRKATDDRWPPDIRKKMDERGLNHLDVQYQTKINYHGVNPTSRQSNLLLKTQYSWKSGDQRNITRTNTKRYGTTAGDAEIDVEMVDPDVNRMLDNCKMDKNAKNNVIFNQRLDGVEMSLKLDGIEGLRIYDVFNCSGVPAKYYNKGVFAITGVKHAISAGDWTTDLECMYFPG